jgi:hypothetical protein
MVAMAKARKLKVFRTPVGFHDAYVAAPSQKAALEAWGTSHNLFARGEAELVEDPDLTAEPLAHPGRVIKRLRGTTEQQFAALPADKPRDSARRTESSTGPKRRKVPHPNRGPLDEAEAALARATRRHAAALDGLAREEEALRRRRREAETARDAELAKLGSRADRLRAAYERALERWRANGR